ncbi:MAG: SDR family NAD(P)-dependent oxidoreductase [Alphaproteobacteria bacterium]
MGRLDGKIALITGGASGLGAGTAQRFVEEGATVIISDVQHELATETARQLGASYIHQDVVSEQEWEAVIAKVIGQHGRLDVLVNNAGVFAVSPVDEMPLEMFQRVIDINVNGVFLGCKHGVRAMKNNPDGPSGSIINLSSVSGLRSQPGGAAYNASKGAVRLLTKTVALENAGNGIRCNSIHPGIIETPILDPVFAASDDPAAVRAGIANTIPMKDLGEPARDIGNMAVYLGSDESVYVTGAEMVVDGGLTIGLPS